ncbi:MAG: PadR family transcriptional regulator [Acidobacteria bacterium]|nr:PadR family transcriptional regulator [Acidobacteriota bacterium]
MADASDPNALLPLKNSTYRVLLALADESLHGYAIMQSLQTITGGRESILPGTLYAALARMEDEGLIERATAPDDDTSGGPARRYHRRTDFGRAVAEAESERIATLLDVARSQDMLAERAK